MAIGVLLDRHVLAPIAGAAALLTAALVLGVGWLPSLALGACVWGGALLLFKPAAPAPAAPAVEEAMAQIGPELIAAERRLERLKALIAERLTGSIAEQLRRIVATAAQMVADVRRDPSDYKRLRKVLTRYLEHVEIIADRIALLAGMGELSEAIDAKTRTTLGDLETVFREYKRRIAEAELFDLDTRIAILEAEISQEGIGDIFRARRERTEAAGGAKQ